MKKTLLLLIPLLAVVNVFAQEITGDWFGALKVQGIQLRLVFHIAKTDSGFSATMDSPDQGAKGIPVTEVHFADAVLKLAIPQARIEYQGSLTKEQVIEGSFKQAGQVFPLNLSRDTIGVQKTTKPQEPKLPYPYHTEDVIFKNTKANISLAGTLTLPNKEGNYPVVILISGSGPQNRDEELLGHKPFLVLSDHLTRNGIAVLRYDDRGTAKSEGNFQTATSADFATDVQAAVQYLLTRKEINKKQIGLIGHSEGGMIAPTVAATSKDIAFIVLLAGPGIAGGELLLLQQQLIGKASGVSDADLEKSHAANKKAFDMVAKSNNLNKLKTELTSYLQQEIKKDSTSSKPEGMSDEDFIKLQVNQIASPWMQYFIKYNPAINLEKVKCPVLAINGAKDLQVPAEVNLTAIKKALSKGGNRNVTTKELPNLNHLFQESETGAPSEYASIQQTFAPQALKEISDWILQQVK
jgi:fermentation-respiration switch protein FrsA (DUF1100 family)